MTEVIRRILRQSPQESRLCLIKGGTKFIYRDIVNGKPAWSNAYILEIGCDSPFKRMKHYLVEQSPDPGCFQKMVDMVLKSDLCEIRVMYIRDECVALGNENFTTHANIVDVRWFMSRYKNVRFKSSAPEQPIAVYDSNELVGLMMYVPV